MPRVLIFLILGPLALAGCADFPELDIAVAPGAQSREFPALVPIDPLVFVANSEFAGARAQVRTFSVRVDLLRARARALQRPVIDRRTRRRLAAAVRRHAP